MLHVDVNAPPPASPAKEEDPGSPCINAAVLRGATSPSAMGDEAAAAALRAAKDFYRLFFRWGATDEVAGTPMLRPLRKHVARRSRRNPRPLTPPPHPLLLPRALTSSSSGGTLSSRSSSGGSTHAREGQPQNSNGSEREEMMMRMDAACACASEPQTQWEQPEPGTLLHNGSFDVMAAHRTPNHTFFPPTLNRDHRREVIRAMLGRDARRYSQWRWRRSSIFIEEHHGTSSRATTANNNNNNNSHEAAAVATVPPPMRLGSEAVLFDPQGHLIPDTTTTTSSTTSTITPPPPTTTTTCAGTANVLPRVASATANATQPPTRACSTTHDSHDDGSHVSSPLHPHVSEAAAPELYSIPASHQGPQYFAEAPEDGATTLVILMVGLPARGKTFLAQKICRLLGWHGTRAQVMNLQLLWRRALNAESLSSGATTTTTPPPPQSHHRHSNSVGGLPNNNNSGSFVPVERFRHLITDPGSVERRVYREVLQQAVRDGEAFFRGGGEVFVVNDDFVTEDLRAEAEARFAPLAKQLLFIEVMRDADLNARFLRCKVSDHAEYPKGRISHHDAKRDFFDRLAFLEEVYEPLASCSTDENSSNNNNNNNTLVNPERRYIKLVNADYIESHGVRGYLASRIISYAMSLSEVKIQHPIYFVRHGESCYQTEDRIGGNSLLTRQGLSDAAAILEFLESLKGHLQYVDATRQQQQRPLFPSPTAAAPAGEEGGVGEGSWPLHGGFGPTHSLTNNNNNTTTTTTHSMPIESSNNTNTTSPSTTTSYTHHQHHPHHLHGLHPHTHSNSCGSPYAGSSSFAASPHLCIDNSNADNLEVWTSQLRRSIQTAELSEHLLGIRTVYWSSLNEVHAGVCEDMTAAEVRRTYPLIDQFRQQAKYTFRYPEGESYQDLALRLEPVIMELENADKVVVVVAHTAVLRCLLAYFGGTSAERSVHVQVEPGTVWRCIYDSKGIPRLDEVGLERDVALKTVLREMPTTTPRQE